MHRGKIIEGNTRDTAKITEQEEYAEFADLSTSDTNTSIRIPLPKHPIFPIIKHYPTPWARHMKQKARQADI